MTAVDYRMQNLAASRRQTEKTAETGKDETVRQAGRTEQAAQVRRAPEEAAQGVQAPQERELPDVGQLNNANEALAQMRIQPSNAADRAFELYRAGARPQGAQQAQGTAQAQNAGAQQAAAETERTEAQSETARAGAQGVQEPPEAKPGKELPPEAAAQMVNPPEETETEQQVNAAAQEKTQQTPPLATPAAGFA